MKIWKNLAAIGIRRIIMLAFFQLHPSVTSQFPSVCYFLGQFCSFTVLHSSFLSLKTQSFWAIKGIYKVIKYMLSQWTSTHNKKVLFYFCIPFIPQSQAVSVFNEASMVHFVHSEWTTPLLFCKISLQFGSLLFSTLRNPETTKSGVKCSIFSPSIQNVETVHPSLPSIFFFGSLLTYD